ncbi:MAG: hypothetical protein R3B96_24650 [Pirellulaceae bacterium]
MNISDLAGIDASVVSRLKANALGERVSRGRLGVAFERPARGDDDPFADQIVDTETGDPAERMDPIEAARTVAVEPGFGVTLFAGEPEVRQPIAMASDRFGRLWVVENYTYAESGRRL